MGTLMGGPAKRSKINKRKTIGSANNRSASPGFQGVMRLNRVLVDGPQRVRIEDLSFVPGKMRFDQNTRLYFCVIQIDPVTYLVTNDTCFHCRVWLVHLGHLSVRRSKNSSQCV